MATWMSKSLSRALKILPIPPRPISAAISYLFPKESPGTKEKSCIPVGKTNSYDALAAAFAIAKKANARSPGRTAADTIYLMTDAGKPNRGRFLSTLLLVDGVALLNYGRHITLHTVGVGTSIDQGMLNDLARHNGGTMVTR